VRGFGRDKSKLNSWEVQKDADGEGMWDGFPCPLRQPKAITNDLVDKCAKEFKDDNDPEKHAKCLGLQYNQETGKVTGDELRQEPTCMEFEHLDGEMKEYSKWENAVQG
jgi:hypothetical protein